MLTTERGENLSARNETVVRKACQQSWGGLKILQSPCVLLIHKKKKKKIIGKNQLQCPAELIVPRQSIIISVASCFPSISSLSLLCNTLPFAFLLFFYLTLYSSTTLDIVFLFMTNHWNKRKNSCERKKENSLRRNHFLKRKSNLVFFPGELKKKKRSLGPPLCKVAGLGYALAQG